MIKVNEKLQQLNPGWTTSHSDPSKMKVWVTQPGTELWPPAVLAGGKHNTEWVVADGSYKYQLQPCNWLQK